MSEVIEIAWYHPSCASPLIACKWLVWLSGEATSTPQWVTVIMEEE